METPTSSDCKAPSPLKSADAEARTLKGRLKQADPFGPAGTLEILLEGAILDSAAAYAKGLVSRVVPDDMVEDEARDTALRIAAGAPLVNRWHKRFVRRLTDGGAPLTEAEQNEAYAAFETDDYLEGVLAFLERRDPRFKGR